MIVKISPTDSLLVVVDMQQKFMKIIPDSDSVIDRVAWLCRMAGKLDIPILATEQNPEKLGPTTEKVARELSSVAIPGKMVFSCLGAEGFEENIKKLGKKSAVVCGIEAQVCVLQTCLDLLESGMKVHVPVDGVASRLDFEREWALRRLEGEGVRLETTESLICQWLGRAGTPEFKEFQEFMKARKN